MYISAPPGIKLLAKHLMPQNEYDRLDEVDFNVYGEDKSVTILQFMRDLNWIYISYDEGDRISLKPTETGIDIFEHGLTTEYLTANADHINLIRRYLEHYLRSDRELSEETLRLADHYLKSGSYNRALDLASSLIEMGNRERNYRVLGRAHHIYGTINLYKMDLDFAKNHFEKAITFSENIDDISNVAKSNLGLGSYYGYKGDGEKALQLFERSQLLFREIDDYTGLNQVKLNEAFALAKMGNIQEFFTLNHQAISYFNEASDDYHLQWCYQNESSVLLSMGEYDTAIDAVVEAHHLATKTGNERVKHLSGLNIALIYLYTQRPGDSYEYIEKAFEYFRKNFDTNGLGSCYELFMAYDVSTKNLSSADRNLEKAIQNFSVKKQNSYIVESLAVYVKLLKFYKHSPEIIKQTTTEFKQKSKDYGLEELFKGLIEE